MKKNKAAELIKNLTRNKTYQMLFAIVVSAGIIYAAYLFAIGEMVQNRKAIQERIETTDTTKLKQSINKLNTKKKELSQKYKTLQKDFKAREGEIFQTRYPIISTILEHINSYSFNIHKYKLDPAFKQMDVTVEGSYQNLIRFIDFLGTIPAKVTLSRYKITLSETNMMIINMTIQVEPVRI